MQGESTLTKTYNARIHEHGMERTGSGRLTGTGEEVTQSCQKARNTMHTRHWKSAPDGGGPWGQAKGPEQHEATNVNRLS